MSTERIKTQPDISLTSPNHIAGKLNREETLWMWQRNVIDEFKSLSNEEIKQKLAETARPSAALFENLLGDFNMATGIRNANAFNLSNIFYLGDKKFDKRGVQGIHNYSNLVFLRTIEELSKLKDQYTFIGIDNIPGAIPIDDYVWPDNTCFVFGEEGCGLTPYMQEFCKELVYIKQFGSVRSMNVGTVSGIVMYDYTHKYMQKSCQAK